MVKFVVPSLKYKKSFLAALKEFEKDKMPNNEPKYTEIASNFSEYVKKYTDYRKGKNLPEGIVQETRMWLVRGSRYLGMVSIRHTLTSKLKRHGGHIGYSVRPSERRKGYGTLLLMKGKLIAKKIGITNALLTCDISNVPSRKIIESAGGVAVKNDKLALPGSMRYKIKIF